MGVRTAMTVTITCFLLGTLATHFFVDSLTLWRSPSSNSNLYIAAQYYTLLARAPIEMAYVLLGVALFGAAFITWSLFDLRAGNLMFDGGSLFLYVSALSVYLYQVVPTILDNFVHSPISLKNTASSGTFPTYLRKPTLDLASSHLVCSVAMTGVIILQAGKWWADGENRGWKDVSSIKEKSE